MFEKFEQKRHWSESHTSYELSSLSKNIIYEFPLSFNGGIQFFEIIWYNLYKGIDSLFKCYIEREESCYVKKCNIL